MTRALAGLRVVSFESRRAEETAHLIRHHGADPIVAPSMREVPLQDQHEAAAFGERLLAGEIDVLILLTGVGARTLVGALLQRWPQAEVLAALGRLQLVARGPKPVTALAEWNLKPSLTVPEPNTWRDILSALDARQPVRGRRVAVQEYGVSNPELLQALKDRGADVRPVPVYSWRLPEDLAPLRSALRRIAQGEADVLLFTSATQVKHVLQVADSEGLTAAVRTAVKKMLVASIGPVCSEALRAAGWPPDIEPSRPKLGELMRALSTQAPDMILQKRA
jgi:uroporphyrinogen-III synthase